MDILNKKQFLDVVGFLMLVGGNIKRNLAFDLFCWVSVSIVRIQFTGIYILNNTQLKPVNICQVSGKLELTKSVHFKLKGGILL
jgi:hypothetical protein